MEVAGDAWIDGVYRTSSDGRLKTNIQSLNSLNCLKKIQQLNGKSYFKRNYPIIDKEKEIDKLLASGKIKKSNVAEVVTFMNNQEGQISDKKQFGFIAQDIEKVFPELVSTDENGYLSVDYQGLIPVLIEALKEQQLIINKQREELEKVLDELKEYE